MTDSVGEDGYVKLRVYDAASTYLAVGCRACGHPTTLSIARVVRLVGGETTVGQLMRRLRCVVCGHRRAILSVAVDTRPSDLVQREGLLTQVRDEP
jgi:DNA-directed RNA polymerase subunit RPC12/RpoP